MTQCYDNTCAMLAQSKISIDGDNRVTYADRRGHDATANDVSGLSWGNSYRLVMATILERMRQSHPTRRPDPAEQQGTMCAKADWCPSPSSTYSPCCVSAAPSSRLRQVETYGVKGLANDEFRAAAELVIGLRKASE